MADVSIRIRADKSELDSIRAEILELQGKKIDLKFNAQTPELRKIEGKILDLQRRKLKLNLSTAEGRAELNKINAELRELTQKKREVKFQSQLERDNINKQIATLEHEKRKIKFVAELQNYSQVFNKIQGLTSKLGSTTISLGNALTRMTSPVNAIMRGAMYRVGYGAINKLTEGFAGSFERYDTMRNYSKSLKALGYTAEQSQKAINDLEQSVLGLPTGLDEIVAAQKRYLAASGDIEKSTKIAIATNNALLASGADESNRRFGERQIRNLLSSGKLTAMQWDSLVKAMPLAMQAVAQEMGFAQKDVGKMVSGLKAGEISADAFLDTLSKVGTEGKIKEAADVMKVSFEGLTANIQNATKRMGEGIIKSLDDVFKKSTGRDLLQNLLGVDQKGKYIGGGIKGFIDDISSSLQAWVRANPEKITNFFNSIRNYDWKGLFSGMAQGFMGAAKWAGKLLSPIMKLTSTDIGKWMVQLNLLGRFLQVFGMGVKGLSPLAGGLAVLAKFLSKRGIFTAASIGIGGLVKKLASLRGLLKGAVLTSGLSKLGGAIGKFVGGATNPRLKTMSALYGAASPVEKAVVTWQNVASKLVTGVNFALVGVAFKQMAQAVKELDSVKFSPGLAGKVAGLATAMTAMTGALTGIGALLGSNPAGWLGLAGAGAAGGIAWLGSKAFQNFTSGIKNVAESVTMITGFKVPTGESLRRKAAEFRKLKPAMLDLWKAVKAVYEETKPGNWFSGLFKRFEVGHSKSVYGAYEKIFGSFNKIGEEVGKLATTKLRPSQILKASNNITSIGEALKQLDDAIDEAFSGVGGATHMNANPEARDATQGRNLFSTTTLEQYKERLARLDESIKQITGILDSVAEFRQKVDTLTSSTKYKTGKNKGKIKNKAILGLDKNGLLDLSWFEDEMNSFAEMVEGFSKPGHAFSKLELAADKLKQFNIGTFQEQFKKIPQVFDSLAEIRKKTEELTTGKLVKDGKGLTRVGNVFSKKSTGVNAGALDLSPVMKDLEVLGTELNKLYDNGTYAALTRAGERFKGAEITQISKGMKNVGKVFDALGTVYDSIVGAREKLGAKLTKSGVQVNFDSVFKDVESFVNEIYKFDDHEFGEKSVFGKLKSVSESFTAANPGAIKTGLDNLSKVFNVLVKAKNRIYKARQEFGGEHDRAMNLNPLFKEINQLVTQLDTFKTTWETLKTVSMQFEGMNIPQIKAAMSDIGILFGELKNVKNSIVKSFGDYESKTPLLQDSGMTGGFSLLGGAKVPEKDPMSTLMEQIRGMVKGLTEVANELVKVDPSTLQANAEQLKTAIGSIESVVESLRDMQATLPKGKGDKGGFDIILDEIMGAVVSLKTSLAEAEALESNAIRFESAIDAVNEAVSTVTSIDTTALSTVAKELTSGFRKLKKAYNNIKNFEFEAIEQEILINITARIEGGLKAMLDFVAEMVKIRSFIENFKAEWKKKITVNVSARVNTAGLTSFISSSIREAVANAQSEYTKYIRISVNTTISNTVTETINRIQRENLIRAGSSGVARADSRRLSTGGLVGNGMKPLYRGIGGSIFKPKGTDTVPAMLTPGEYVVRRRAVSYFGEKFMQKINNLDIPGAMKALSVRAGNSLAQGSTTIINHNDNRTDNRKIVQNFNGDRSDDRAGYMRANRYLMGLR